MLADGICLGKDSLLRDRSTIRTKGVDEGQESLHQAMQAIEDE
jgi:hypothetical protein